MDRINWNKLIFVQSFTQNFFAKCYFYVKILKSSLQDLEETNLPNKSRVVFDRSLTVLFPKFFTRQFKYVVLPRMVVTFFEFDMSKYGPYCVLLSSRLF